MANVAMSLMGQKRTSATRFAKSAKCRKGDITRPQASPAAKRVKDNVNAA
jgi:hypothetical protein